MMNKNMKKINGHVHNTNVRVKATPAFNQQNMSKVMISAQTVTGMKMSK